MLISLCHPSYGRPDQAFACMNEWVSKSSKFDLEYILALNTNDHTFSRYLYLFGEIVHLKAVSDRFNGMVAASNAAAEASTGQILILVSDDMHPPDGWDELLLSDPNLSSPDPCVLQVHDSIRDDIVTLPIMNRAAYDRLRYLYHPGYVSMFADNDLAETAKTHGMYYRSDIVGFEHHHWINEKALKDATYEREGSSTAWNLGERLFNQRKAEGFPI